MTKTVTLKPYSEDKALRAGDFSLMPINPQGPVIVSQPLKNFIQTTWIEGVQRGVPRYQTIKPTFNTVNVLEGTEFSFGFRVMDPSNVNDFSDISNLSYIWKRDDSHLYELNKLNNGLGVNSILIQSSDSKAGLTGRYVCEISNRFGTIETEPIDINVIDPLAHPKMYKNLILNGDGEGGLDGWQGDPEIITSPFLQQSTLNNVYGSFKLGGMIIWSQDVLYNKSEEGGEDLSKTTPLNIPADFYFCSGDSGFLFHPLYQRRWREQPTFQQPGVKTNIDGLGYDTAWIGSFIPNIVNNEDYFTGNYRQAAFFPGTAWMDTWNKNQSTIGLNSEFASNTSTYFTRDKLKFIKFNGKPNAFMSQVVDLSEAADFIDGAVYGVKYTTSQFFAYVGAGITGYKIKLKTADGDQTFNYYIGDTEHLYDRFYQTRNLAFPEVRAKGLGNKKYKVLPDSPIEITPIVDDQVSITLDYYDEFGRVLKTETINGPNETDVWAIKEKVYFPLSLLPLFLFVQPNHNPITVFGQTYTTTDALLPLFTEPASGNTGLLDFTKSVPSSLTDVTARFLLNKYNPKTNTILSTFPDVPSVQKRSVEEYGAAAMFGVGKNIIVPFKTRSVNITVAFKHKSDIIYDMSPELKGWTGDTIYSNEMGQSTGVSARLAEYGNSRSAITKMKFLLGPNEIEISDKYATYSLPPANRTVLGLQKAKYNVPNAFNSAVRTDFNYERDYLVNPGTLPDPIKPASPFILSKDLATYIAEVNTRLTLNIRDASEGEANMGSSQQLGYSEDLNQQSSGL